MCDSVVQCPEGQTITYFQRVQENADVPSVFWWWKTSCQWRGVYQILWCFLPMLWCLLLKGVCLSVCLSVYLSVCPSVTSWYCMKTS